MRYIYTGITKTGGGVVIPSCTISVYLAGGTTAASIYEAKTGGSAVNSVTSDSTTGRYTFYVDDTVYAITQEFKIVVSKSGYTQLTFDNIPIFIGVPLTGSLSWNPGSLADEADATNDVTVTGASIGDIAMAGFPCLVSSVASKGWQISAHVTAANTVTVCLKNCTGSTVDLDSGTLKVAVWKT